MKKLKEIRVKARCHADLIHTKPFKSIVISLFLSTNLIDRGLYCRYLPQNEENLGKRVVCNELRDNTSPFGKTWYLHMSKGVPLFECLQVLSTP